MLIYLNTSRRSLGCQKYRGSFCPHPGSRRFSEKERKNPRSDGAEAAVLQSGKFLHGGKTEGIPGILLLTKIFALAEGGDISAELIKKSPGNGAFYFERSIPGRFFLSDPAE